MYADGSVSANGTSVKLTLKTQDNSILYKINTLLEHDRPLYVSPPSKIKNTNYISSGNYCLLIDSSKIKKDLIKQGCFPNKTYTLKFPTEEQVPKSLIWHFIRGFFDGDGSITKVSKSKLCTVSFIGTFDMLINIQNVLKNINIKSRLLLDPKNKKVYYLSFSNRGDVLNFSDYLYKNSNLHLERKFNIFQDWKKLPYDKRKIKSTANN